MEAKKGRLSLVFALALALAGAAVLSAACGGGGGGGSEGTQQPEATATPMFAKMDSTLGLLVEKQKKEGDAAAVEYAKANKYFVKGDLVGISVTCVDSTQATALADKLKAQGATIDRTRGDLILAYVPIKILLSVSELPEVKDLKNTAWASMETPWEATQ